MLDLARTYPAPPELVLDQDPQHFALVSHALEKKLRYFYIPCLINNVFGALRLSLFMI